MIQIPWDSLPCISRKNSFICDIGDLRIQLREQKDCWLFNMTFKVYSLDKSISMHRPYSNITRFAKPCTLEEAKVQTEEYLNSFLTPIADLVMLK